MKKGGMIMYCRNCGKPIGDNKDFCPDCIKQNNRANKTAYRLSIVGFICGIISIALYFYASLYMLVGLLALSADIILTGQILYIVSFVLGALGLVFGIISIAKLRKSKTFVKKDIWFLQFWESCFRRLC